MLLFTSVQKFSEATSKNSSDWYYIVVQLFISSLKPPVKTLLTGIIGYSDYVGVCRSIMLYNVFIKYINLVRIFCFKVNCGPILPHLSEMLNQ